MDLRTLVEDLTATHFESPYLDRLRGRLQRAATTGGYTKLQQEIMGEMAAALGRAEDHVNEALLRLDVLDREIAHLESEPESPERSRRLDSEVARFNELRERAQRRLWELMVHREAIGLRRHETLSQFYPIPPKRSAPP